MYRLTTRNDYLAAFSVAMASQGLRSVYCSRPNEQNTVGYFLDYIYENSGYCLEDGGSYIGGLFSHADNKDMLEYLFTSAGDVAHAMGIRTQWLNCYAPLGPIYERHGWVEVSHEAFHMKDHHPDWHEATHGTPDLLTMKRTLNHAY